MTALLLVGLVVVGVLALFALDSLTRRPVLGAALVLGLVVIEATVDSQYNSISVTGFRVSISDVGFSLLALAAILRLVRGKLSKEQGLLILFGILVVVSFFLGVTSQPIDDAANEFRRYLVFTSAALYFCTTPFDRETLRSILHVWLWAGFAIGGVVLLRWMGRLTGVDLGFVDATYDATIRVLQGPEAMFVASTAVVLTLSGMHGVVTRPKLYQWTGIVLLIISIVLNRRTVWLALLAALIVLLIRERRIGRRAAVIAVAGLVIFTFLLPVFSESSDDQRTARTTDVGTLLWRIEGWTSLLEESGPEEPADYVIGMPFGTGFERTIGGNVKESNPHNFYVQTFLRTGVVGLAILCLLLWLTITSLWKRPPDRTMPLSSNVLVLLLIMQAVWYLAWPPEAEQGLILGLAVALASKDYMGRVVTTRVRADATPTV